MSASTQSGCAAALEPARTFDALGSPVIIQQGDGFVYANRAAELLTGYPADALLRMPLLDLLHPDAHPAARRRCRRGDRPFHSRVKLVHRSGEPRWIDCTAVPIVHGGAPALLCSGFDVTGSVHLEEESRLHQTSFEEFIESAPEAVVVTCERRIRHCNSAFTALFGYERDEVLGRFLDELLIPEDRRHEFAEAQEHIRRNVPFRRETVRRTKTGEQIDVFMFSAPVCSEGARVGTLVVYHDIRERRRAERRLEHDALHDPLTQLANRTLLVQRLEEAVERRRLNPERNFAVLFLDLDRFKIVNDSLGHITGDRLLVQTAERLRASVRPGDTAARLGGDEFVLLLDPVCDAGEAVETARRVEQAIREPFSIEGREFYTSVSIGIALADDQADPCALLRDADAAMYRAKAFGRNRHQLFDASMRAQALALLELETDLRRAVQQDEFVVWYQPIMDLRTGGLLGLEALVRWSSPQRGLVPPAAFIPVAEETGLILDIGRRVLEMACLQVQHWNEAFGAELSVNVNISACQFSQADLLDDIVGALRRSGLPPRLLKLEITESVVMEDPASAETILHRLKELGVEVCLDDFGTGYSSLSHLLRFPIDTIKIDRTFVQSIDTETARAEVVRAIVHLAKSLRKYVVAEGVETGPELERLQGLECDQAQGYLFARPMDSARAEDLLRGTRLQPQASLVAV